MLKLGQKERRCQKAAISLYFFYEKCSSYLPLLQFKFLYQNSIKVFAKCETISIFGCQITCHLIKELVFVIGFLISTFLQSQWQLHQTVCPSVNAGLKLPRHQLQTQRLQHHVIIKDLTSSTIVKTKDRLLSNYCHKT